MYDYGTDQSLKISLQFNQSLAVWLRGAVLCINAVGKMKKVEILWLMRKPLLFSHCLRKYGTIILKVRHLLRDLSLRSIQTGSAVIA